MRPDHRASPAGVPEDERRVRLASNATPCGDEVAQEPRGRRPQRRPRSVDRSMLLSRDLSDAETFADWLMPLRQCEWVVYAERPFAGLEQVLAYLSRYESHHLRRRATCSYISGQRALRYRRSRLRSGIVGSVVARRTTIYLESVSRNVTASAHVLAAAPAS
jgi:hypothetical protein